MVEIKNYKICKKCGKIKLTIFNKKKHNKCDKTTKMKYSEILSNSFKWMILDFVN